MLLYLTQNLLTIALLDALELYIIVVVESLRYLADIYSSVESYKHIGSGLRLDRVAHQASGAVHKGQKLSLQIQV